MASSPQCVSQLVPDVLAVPDSTSFIPDELTIAPGISLFLPDEPPIVPEAPSVVPDNIAVPDEYLPSRINTRRPNDSLLFDSSSHEPLFQPSIPLHPHGLAHVLRDYPDPQFVDTLVSIACHGQ